MPLPPLRDPPGRGRRMVGLAKAIPAAIVLFATLIAFNVLQVFMVIVRLFSRRAFNAFTRWAANLWWGWSVRTAQWLHGAHLILTGDPVPPREKAIVVTNHQQMADVPFLMMFARSRGRLGDMRWFVKDVLKWIPGVGWGLWLMGSFFVKRDWAADRAGIERTFARMRNDRRPLWVIVFAEGTRVTPRKIEKSRAFAKERGLEPLEHLLLPRPRGFVGSVIGLREHVDAVYDVTIGYEVGVPTLWQYMKGFVTRAHLHVRRFPIAELPADDEALTRWIHDRYREKDRLLAGYYASGRFPA